MRTVRQWARQTTGGLPATFWYLWTGTLINRIGSFVTIFLAIYLTSARHFSPASAGLVIGLYGLGGAAGTLTGGVLADRWGRRPTLLTAQLGGATLMVALGFLQHPVAMAVGALALGTFSEAARPAFSAMMIDVVPERDRLRAYTLNYWAINLGFAFASVLGGLLAQVDYLLIFIGDAATTVITAGILLTRVRETRPAVAATPLRTAGLRTAFRDRVFLGFVGLNFLIAVVFLQHLSTLPIAMRHHGLSPAMYGAVIALNGVLIVAGQLFVPRLIAGRSHSRTLAVAAVVVGLGFGLNAVVGSALGYAGTVLIWTLGEMLNSPSGSTLLAELSPVALRGRYQGVYSLSWQAASFTAPVLGGYVQQTLGDAAVWLGSAVVAVLAAAGHLIAAPARERRIAPTGGQTTAAAGPESGVGSSAVREPSPAVPAI